MTTRFTLGGWTKCFALASRMTRSFFSHLFRTKGPEPAELRDNHVIPLSPLGYLSVFCSCCLTTLESTMLATPAERHEKKIPWAYCLSKVICTVYLSTTLMESSVRPNWVRINAG